MPKAKKVAPTKKKIVKKPVVKKIGKLVGSVIHYYDHIGVGVIRLSTPLSEGDEIRIMGGENTDFNQKVVSMQIDHEKVKKAKKSNTVGLKVKEKVRDGYKVYKA